MMTEIEIEHLRQWIGRSELAEDIITPGLLARFRATLADKAGPDEEDIPLCLHWCLAPAAVHENRTGPDGHPARGGFLPPVPLERRMWGGGDIRFVMPFESGDLVVRTSTIASVEAKAGSSGPLVIVGVDHEYSTERGLAVQERQNLVYRNPGSAPAPSRSRTSARQAFRTREIEASTLFMFRYSALTFNGHRIHYDRDYAMNEEGYPGLVFHGPLQATLLANFAREVGQGELAEFSYKGVSPLFGGEVFTVNSAHVEDGTAELWCADHNGMETMIATARFR